MQSSAIISHDGCHRYELRRVWDAGKPLLVVCMFNPSTADAEKNDPTILALIGFATAWGYGGLLVINLFSIRSSSPAHAAKHPYRQGQANVHWYRQAITFAKEQGKPVLVAWGNNGVGHTYGILDLIHRHDVTMICLGTTASGEPKHPMARGKHRIPRDQQPVAWP